MKDKHGNDVVFVINNEEGEYISHLKKYTLCDNYQKPNRNDFNLANCDIGKLMQTKKTNNLHATNTEEVKKINIHKGHRKRLREMFNKVNPTSLPEHQILEIMLSFVQPQKDVNPLAHTLLNEFGSLANVLDANVEDLLKVKGIGEVLATYIHFCSTIPAVYKSSKINFNISLKNPSQIVDYIRSNVAFGNTEEFFYLCLDVAGNVLTFKSLGSGSVSKIKVDKRELVQNILRYPTDCVVICHTHPNGSPLPSLEDKTFTLNLFSLLEGLGIRLADHVIVSPMGFFSFFSQGTSTLGRKSDLRSKILFGIPDNLTRNEYADEDEE